MSCYVASLNQKIIFFIRNVNERVYFNVHLYNVSRFILFLFFSWFSFLNKKIKWLKIPVEVERNKILAALVVLKNIIKRKLCIYYCYIEFEREVYRRYKKAEDCFPICLNWSTSHFYMHWLINRNLLFLLFFFELSFFIHALLLSSPTFFF